MSVRHPFAIRAHVALACVTACAACGAPAANPAPDHLRESLDSRSPIAPPALQDREEARETTWPPAPDFTDEQEWIQLTSGEWLKGEFVSLSRATVQFDSAELDELTLDWEDVSEVVTTRPFTVVRADRATLVGAVRVHVGTVFVRAPDGISHFPRAELMRMIRKVEGRANWSGSVRLGGTHRSGNTDQTDATVHIHATRRTANSRTVLSLDQVFSETDGSRTADNQSFHGNQDVYVSPRFYLTPFGIELFRDSFQNIDLRATPYTGLGYTLIERSSGEWNMDAGLGYRYTRFDSVAVGEDDTRETATVRLSSAYEQDLTRSVQLALAYQVQVGLEDTSDTNQEASVLLSFDFVWDLDFDVRFVWKYVGQPEPDESGVTPKNTDLRIDLGLSWEF